MKKLLIAACLTSSAWAAPFLYNFSGAIDVSASMADFTASIDLDGDTHQLFYSSATDLVTGGMGVAVSAVTPDIFNFSFQSLTSGAPGPFGTNSGWAFSQTPGTVYEDPAPTPPGSASVGNPSFPTGNPITFSGGGFGPDFTISFTALAVDLAPELDEAAATLPLLSALLLLGLAGKRSAKRPGYLPR